jgi:hypothetical protein
MELTKEEFNDQFRETVDTILVAMAEHAEIDLEKFYSMACILENLAFFSPVIYGAINKSGKESL